MNKCIYKETEDLRFKKVEHVIPAGLGGTATLPKGYVSDMMNEMFSAIEAKALRTTTLTIPCNWSYGSFYSNDIVMGTLILNGDFEAIHYRGNGNFGFQSITAETVIYDIPAAGITSTDTKT